MLVAVACVDDNWGIGYNNSLLCHDKDDMTFFKFLTDTQHVIMGRKTFESLPDKRKFAANRKVTVITRNPETINEYSAGLTDDQLPNIATMDLDTIIKLAMGDPKHVTYVLGGGEIYKQILPYCEGAWISHVHKKYDQVDTYFPDLNNLKDWENISPLSIHKQDVEIHCYKNKRVQNTLWLGIKER